MPTQEVSLFLGIKALQSICHVSKVFASDAVARTLGQIALQHDA